MKNSAVLAGIVTLLLLLAEVVVIVGSWIGSVVWPDSITSMLSSAGVRWFVGSFSSILATPLLVNILLVGIALGILRRSGLADVIRSGNIKNRSYSERLGVQLSAVTFILLMLVVLLLTFLPHAVLVNASGSIINSSFSRGFIPMIAFSITVPSVVFGVCTSRTASMTTLTEAFAHGISLVSPFLLLYLMSAQLYYSVMYVFA